MYCIYFSSTSVHFKFHSTDLCHKLFFSLIFSTIRRTAGDPFVTPIFLPPYFWGKRFGCLIFFAPICMKFDNVLFIIESIFSLTVQIDSSSTSAPLLPLSRSMILTLPPSLSFYLHPYLTLSSILFLILSLSLFLTHSLSLSLTHSLCLSLSHSVPLPLSQTLSLTLTLSLSLILSVSLSLSLPLPLSHTLSLCLSLFVGAYNITIKKT